MVPPLIARRQSKYEHPPPPRTSPALPKWLLVKRLRVYEQQLEGIVALVTIHILNLVTAPPQARHSRRQLT